MYKHNSLAELALLKAELMQKNQLVEEQAKMLEKQTEKIHVLEQENKMLHAENDAVKKTEFECKTISILNDTGIKTFKGGQIRPFNSAVSTRCEGKQKQVWASKGDWIKIPKAFLLQTTRNEEERCSNCEETKDNKKSVATDSTAEDRRVDKAARACDRQEVCQMCARHDVKVASRGN
eukprot:557918-Ditylum_brightwellii.AAC.1